YRVDDFGALRDLVNAAGAPARTMTDRALEEFLDYPWFQPGTDLFVVPADGRPGLAGARDVRVWARGDEAVPILESWGVRHPSLPEDGPERDLFRAMLERAGHIVTQRGAERGIVQVRCDTDNAHAIALFESFGLRPARVLLTILRPTLDGLNPAQFPSGLAVRPYRVGQDEEAWVRAFNEAFADHWGGFMGMSLPLWARYVRRPWFKPEISLVAWDGQEIAGFGHFVINDEQNALSGKKRSLMRYIGVRPRWRGIKLGVALTRAGLIASRDKGMESCASGVDSENVTGAHHIYEREGFVTTKRHFLYRTEVSAPR
ncbi:MAG TPA: GNAT family N-acetyltransferase, partial [bacterium]|nr:GNAT family N-acetyltransferase [bacterium]